MQTQELLTEKAEEAVLANIQPFNVQGPYEIKIVYSDCRYLKVMQKIHPEIFVNENTVLMRGDNLLATWSEYLSYEKEMVTYSE